MMIQFLSLIVLILLVALAAGRVRMLRRRGVNAFVFGATDKSDFLLMPMILFFFYTVLSCVFGLPLHDVLKRPFWQNAAMQWVGLFLCAASLVWFALTLRSFGVSFRIGIDEKTPDRLVTSGMFALSRNPIYVAFLSFILGMLLVYPNLATLLVLVLFAAVIHRQVLREEKFLKSYYGKEYEEYCRRVRRYL